MVLAALNGLALCLLAAIWIKLSRTPGELGHISQQIDVSIQNQSRENRLEILNHTQSAHNALLKRLSENAELQQNGINAFATILTQLTTSNESRLTELRTSVETRLKELQDDNGKKLELMRQTVDEKLHATLEKRLGDSFKLVSDRLELVHKGLGEMQNLATGVGDLKRVLTNVKTRGTWGEIQLGALLEQFLTPDQFQSNVQIKSNSLERVEYAVKFPGKSGRVDSAVWLSIDSKFPLECFHRLQDAQEKGDPDLLELAQKELELAIKKEAKSIEDKYINPPFTVDFAVLFLPFEALYAEVLRLPGLYAHVQQHNRVTIAGPTNLAALLSSFQMGFRTLAVEQRSSEVWQLLGTVKQEFGRFGDILDKTNKKLQEASNVIGQASQKSRTIERKLRQVSESGTEGTIETAELIQDDLLESNTLNGLEQ